MDSESDKTYCFLCIYSPQQLILDRRTLSHSYTLRKHTKTSQHFQANTQPEIYPSSHSISSSNSLLLQASNIAMLHS